MKVKRERIHSQLGLIWLNKSQPEILLQKTGRERAMDIFISEQNNMGLGPHNQM